MFHQTRPETSNSMCPHHTPPASGAPWWPLGAALLSLLLLLSPIPAEASSLSVVSDLALPPGSEAQALILTLSGQPHSVRSFVMSKPSRLAVDIAAARLQGDNRSLPAQHDLIHGVRIAQFKKDTVRVVLDLKREVRHLVSSRPAPGDPTRHEIIVNLLPQAPDAALPGPSPAPLLPQAALDPAGGIASEPAPALSLAKREGEQNRKIVFSADDKSSQRPQEETSPWGAMDFSGFAMAKGTQEMHESGDSEQARMFRNTLRLEGKWTPPAWANAQQPKGETSNTFVLASVQSDYLWFGPTPSSDDYDLELYEGYLFRATPDWDLRLGRQIVRWGKADQISPVDNINPQDMREFFLPDLEDRKIPNWMARVRLFPDLFTLEGVFVPFFEENRFDYTGSKFALLGSEPNNLRINESEPGNGLDNAALGLRTSTTVAGWDFALSYLYTREKSPRLRLDPASPAGPTLHADYPRQHIFGWEFETTFDKFGFRGEGAYFDGQSMTTESLDSVSTPVLHSVLGLDYMGEQDWYANVQLTHQHVFEYESDILFSRRDNFYLNGEVNREFWRGDLMLKLRYALDIRDGGMFLTPEAILKSFRNLELSLGAYLFFGPSDTLFGRYQDNDQAFLKATYRF